MRAPESSPRSTQAQAAQGLIRKEKPLSLLPHQFAKLQSSLILTSDSGWAQHQC
jgi:hypothetical protein